MKKSLRERLLRYLLNNHGYVSNGELQRIVMANSKFTADNAARRLRELRADGLLDVEIRKGHAWYKAKV